jgi:tetratricopeptide (TPR) repeat protein
MRNCFLSIPLLFLFFLPSQLHAQSFDELMQQASVARDHGEDNKAIELYSKAISLRPNSAEAYYERGRIQSMTNQNNGIGDLLKAVELDSTLEWAFHQIAFYYSFKGDEAKSDFYELKAITLNPNSANNLLLMAQRFLAKGDSIKALEYCNLSIEKHDEAVEWLALLERAKIRYNLREYKGAAEDFEKCFNEFSYGMYQASDYEMCGDAYKELGQMKQACEKWNMAITQLDPEIDKPSKTVQKKIKKFCKG